MLLTVSCSKNANCSACCSSSAPICRKQLHLARSVPSSYPSGSVGRSLSLRLALARGLSLKRLVFCFMMPILRALILPCFGSVFVVPLAVSAAKASALALISPPLFLSFSPHSSATAPSLLSARLSSLCPSLFATPSSHFITPFSLAHRAVLPQLDHFCLLVLQLAQPDRSDRDSLSVSPLLSLASASTTPPSLFLSGCCSMAWRSRTAVASVAPRRVAHGSRSWRQRRRAGPNSLWAAPN